MASKITIRSGSDARTAAGRLVGHWALAAALVVGGALRIHWAMLLPYNGGPDEAHHFPMVEYVRSERRPPTMADVPGRVPVSYPALPPVGYLPCALACAFSSPDDPLLFRTARFGNVVVGLLTLLVAFRATRLLVRGNPIVANLVVWILALHPQLVFLHAYVNNDASAVFAATAIWWLCVRTSRSNPTVYAAAALGALAGIALLCKLNTIGVALAGLSFAMYQLRAAAARPIVIAGALTVTLASCGVVIAPWIAWSLSQHGSFWGADIHRHWWIAHVAEIGEGQPLLSGDNLSLFVASTWKSLWASFGYCTVWLDDVHYLALTSLCGFAVGAVWRSRDAIAAAIGDGDVYRGYSVIASMLMGTFLVAASHVAHSASFGLAPQGRYLMPAIWPIVTTLALGFIPVGTQGQRKSGFLDPLARRTPRVLRAAVAPGFVVLLLAWCCWSSADKTRKSLRVRQPDRRVRADVVAYRTPWPSRHGFCSATLRATGTARVDSSGAITCVHTVTGGGVLRPIPKLTDPASYLEVYLHRDRGELNGGRLVICDVVEPTSELATFAYSYPEGGVVRLRFDLRDIGAQLQKGTLVAVLLPGDDAAVRILRFDILDRANQTVEDFPLRAVIPLRSVAASGAN